MIVHSETALLEYTWFLNLVQTMDHQRSSKKKKKNREQNIFCWLKLHINHADDKSCFYQ